MSGKSITLPGLVDPHVHLRDPWQLQKEDFYSGTSAALAGGYVAVGDMPNNQEHIVSEELLDKKIASAESKIVADTGFYFSALSLEHVREFKKVFDKCIGIKLFITTTTNMAGKKALNDQEELVKICSAWPDSKPILFHAEDESVKLGIEAAKQTGKRIHFCHISSRLELKPILKAKNEGLNISCGVCPHHLFLTQEDLNELGPKGKMLPSLKTKADQEFLWQNLDKIDIIESDHAPHTLEEKMTEALPGVPGLETTLPLLLTAEAEGKISRGQVIDKLHTQPAKLIGYQPDPKNQIEIDMIEYEIKNENLKTKCGWSPFAGRKVIGKVKKVYLRGELVFENDQIFAQPGSGRIIS